MTADHEHRKCEEGTVTRGEPSTGEYPSHAVRGGRRRGAALGTSSPSFPRSLAPALTLFSAPVGGGVRRAAEVDVSSGRLCPLSCRRFTPATCEEVKSEIIVQHRQRLLGWSGTLEPLQRRRKVHSCQSMSLKMFLFEKDTHTHTQCSDQKYLLKRISMSKLQKHQPNHSSVRRLMSVGQDGVFNFLCLIESPRSRTKCSLLKITKLCLGRSSV